MHTTSLISKAAVRPAALTFHCTVIPGSANSGVEHSHKMQHHSPVRSPAETAEYRLMCSTEPICMGSGESADVRRGDAEEGERKEDEPVFLLRSWRKQAGLVCIVWVTFVKWALLFQLLHYSNTCYWDHWRAHWHQCGVRLSHRVDLGGGRGGGGGGGGLGGGGGGGGRGAGNVHLFWESKQLIHMSPNEGWKGCGTFPQSSQCTVTYVLSWSWGVWEPAETKTRLGASVCVWVRAIVSHRAKTLQHVLVPGFPQQQRQGCTSLTFSLCECDLKGSVETLRANEKVRSCDVVTESAVFSSFVLSAIDWNCISGFTHSFCSRQTRWKRLQFS